MAKPCPCDVRSRNKQPMILCADCSTLYHFTCIGLSTTDANDIASYICDTCHQETGLSSVYTWEGEDALEEVASTHGGDSPESRAIQTPSDEEDVHDNSADETYKDDQPATSKRRRTQNGHTTTPQRGRVVDSESESEIVPSRPLKRKASSAVAKLPAPKRRRSSATPVTPVNPSDDPTRKYCAGKLKDLLEPIFLLYYGWTDATEPPNDRVPETDEGKEMSTKLAEQYVQDLERELFEHYAEPGSRIAGGKYKERFRMLTFNLSKADRIHLRRGIVLGQLQPSTLAQMSSTELASEQGQLAIAEALQASLQQSILEQPRMAAPRAKITHKGTEMIETYDSPASMQFPEREEKPHPRIITNLQKPEREPDTRSATTPSSTIVASPVAMRTPSGTNNTAYFIPTLPPDPAEPSTSVPVQSVELDPYADPTLASLMPDSAAAHDIHDVASPTRRTSFDIGALWTAEAHLVTGDGMLVDVGTFSDAPNSYDYDDGLSMEVDGIGMDPTATGDTDFGMFIDDSAAPGSSAGLTVPQDRVVPEPSIVPPAPAFTDLTPVFRGSMEMPDMPVFTVLARQVGGRPLQHLNTWSQLFTRSDKRVLIEGRVPVKAGADYLTLSRMNAARELVAVTFESIPDGKEDGFVKMFDMLVKKERYGVSLPWATVPTASAIGKELYIIPLPKDAPLPDPIELIDDLQVPRTGRENDLLIGVFFLHKGKVVDLPPPSTADVSSLLSGLIGTPPQASPAPAPAMPTPALTTNQIQLMLRSLGHLTHQAPPPAPAPMIIGPPLAANPMYPPPPPQMYQQPPPSGPASNQHNYAAPPAFAQPLAPGPSRGVFRGGRGGGQPPRGPRGRGAFATGSNAGAPGELVGDGRPRDSGWGSRGRGRGNATH
ncbi:hypothetical protein BKA62DRAFT_688013 [Auriculariales sp. MPI-PUGE-AT-0066]|nr:hypothetical protein BKA62DRAFT_688013 [Auriculariales sp. MPI-PUGE-AT-0066]